MRRVRLVAAAVVALVAIGGPAVAMSTADSRQGSVGDGDVVEVPVAFTVANTNTSQVPCLSDGATYTVRGHLVGPRSTVNSGPLDAVTLYLYGFEGGEWNWHLQDVPGYDHAAEMAKLGHVSVTIDQVGYGASGRPADGNLTCVGAQADITHQMVQQLRRGTYQLGDGAGKGFTSVVLAGHDIGGLAAEVEAYSYHDIDGLIVATMADQGFQPWIVQRNATAAAQWCTLNPAQTPVGEPTGYVHFVSEDEFRNLLFYDADPAVIDAAVAHRQPNPCGLVRSVASATAVDNPSGLLSFMPDGAPPPTAAGRLSQIDVPVLVVWGDHDTLVWTRQGEEQQQSNYTGSPDATTAFIPDAGHFLMFSRSAPQFRAVISSWLTTRGFASPRDASFAGSCSVKGSVHFDPPATNQQQDLSYSYQGTGTCTGTLDGRRVDGAPVAMAHAGRSNASCGEAQTVGPGKGRLTFGDGSVVGYTVTFTSLATEVEFQFQGQRSGKATGQGTFLTSRTPPDVAVHCATDGVRDTPLDIDLSTQSPLTSR